MKRCPNCGGWLVGVSTGVGEGELYDLYQCEECPNIYSGQRVAQIPEWHPDYDDQEAHAAAHAELIGNTFHVPIVSTDRGTQDYRCESQEHADQLVEAVEQRRDEHDRNGYTHHELIALRDQLAPVQTTEFAGMNIRWDRNLNPDLFYTANDGAVHNINPTATPYWNATVEDADTTNLPSPEEFQGLVQQVWAAHDTRRNAEGTTAPGEQVQPGAAIEMLMEADQ